MWQYKQSDGTFSHNGEKIATGYSGFGLHKNDPHSEDVKNLGPIPKGKYHIGPVYDSPNVGPVCMALEALPGVEVFGRGDFRIHGDSIKAPGSASHGCIILPRTVREQIASSGDTELQVVY